MQILCIFAKYPLGDSTNIVKDLANAFHRLGHQVNVVTIKEKRFQGKTNVVIENGYKVLRVKTGNLFDKVALIEKFITMLKLPGKLYRAIIKFFANESYDLIITHTPYMASYKLIRK